MENYKCIFCIVTEHQMLQFYEAMRHFNLHNDQIVLIIFILNNDYTWIEEIRSNFPLISIKIFENWVAKDLIFNRQKINEYIIYINKLKVSQSKIIFFSSQYFSDFSLLTYSVLKPYRYFLLDEGTASFNVVLERKKNKVFNPKLILKSFFYKKKLYYPSNITFFSQYDLDISHFDKIEIYEFEKEKNILAVNSKIAIFLGTSLVELGLMNEKVYLSLMKKIKDDFLSHKSYYYCHRKESSSKLELIRKIGFEIKQNEKPFEFIFSTLNPCPEIIASFSSPILDTISKRKEKIPKFVIYKYDISNLNKKNREITELIYNTFSKNKTLTIKSI